MGVVRIYGLIDPREEAVLEVTAMFGNMHKIIIKFKDNEKRKFKTNG